MIVFQIEEILKFHSNIKYEDGILYLYDVITRTLLKATYDAYLKFQEIFSGFGDYGLYETCSISQNDEGYAFNIKNPVIWIWIEQS